MSDKFYFEYERMSPFIYTQPRDIRMQLQKQICKLYNSEKVSEIPLSTEIILKYIKPKEENKANKILLKYKVVILDWEYTRTLKDLVFISKMFKWNKGEETLSGDYSSDI